MGYLPFTATASPFTDVDLEQWYTKYILFAFEQGYIEGYKGTDGKPNGLFGVNRNITRAEAAKVVVKVRGF